MTYKKQKSRKWLLLIFVLTAYIAGFGQTTYFEHHPPQANQTSIMPQCGDTSHYVSLIKSFPTSLSQDTLISAHYTWSSSNPNVLITIDGCDTCSTAGSYVHQSTRFSLTATYYVTFGGDTGIVVDTGSVLVTAYDDIHIAPEFPNDVAVIPCGDSITLSSEDAYGNTTFTYGAFWADTSVVFHSITYHSEQPIDSNLSYSSGDITFTYNGKANYAYLIALCPTDSISTLTVFDSVHIVTGYPYQQQQICMVTVDSATGHNEVIFEPTHGQHIAEYKIYKQNSTTSDWDSIGAIPFDSLTTFIDYNSNPAQQSSSYAIAVVDSLCGYESPLSGAHTTIHLSANVGTSGEVNLLWNAYVGFSYQTFAIYRSNNGGTFSQIGNSANNVFAYSDLTPPSGTNRYYVAIEKQPACNPSRSISSTISNVLNFSDSSTTTGIAGITTGTISVYPNPFSDKLTISPNVPYKLFDIVGREVYNSENKTNLSPLPTGTYILKTANGSTRVTKIEK